jgi:hypothetical protein
VTGPVYHRAVSLMEADVGDELVALDAAAGSCFGFNAVATAVWRNLENPKAFDELRSELLDEFDVSAEECAAELQMLLDDLIDKGLVERSG